MIPLLLVGVLLMPMVGPGGSTVVGQTTDSTGVRTDDRAEVLRRMIDSGLRHGDGVASGAWRRLETDGLHTVEASLLRNRVERASGLSREYRAGSGGRRSVALAFGLSAVVPGAGQAYNRQWVKTGMAISLEALTVFLWSTKHRDGLQAEEDVYAFAHADWSAARYSEWLNDYVDYLSESFNHNVSAPPAVIPTGIDFTRPDAWTKTEQTQVTQFFNQIRAIERQVFHPETGATFSHQLPYFGEQQYYELIGKYFQFAPGWYDYPAWIIENPDGTHTFTAAIDPELSGPNNTKPNVSAAFRKYDDAHEHSQNLLRSARRMSMLVMVNHLIAAVDAAVSAKLHNDRITTHTGFSMAPDGSIHPVTSIALRF